MKKVLVIGGSKGIGLALVKMLVNDANVISISRGVHDFEHENFESYTCDVLKDEFPIIDSIDTLVYCPGSINLKPFNRISIEDFKEEFDINFFGAVRTIQQYLPVIKKGTNPSVLLFSTVAVKMGMPFHTGVASAKGAIEGLVKSLAAEFAPHVRFNAIAPTLTDTDLASRILRNDKMKIASAERHPLKKYLLPDEVASMAKYLISDLASSISGQIIPLDSGIVNIKL